MENGDIQDAGRPDSQGELANDVALLFSWAKIENAGYRDFSRQRPHATPDENRNDAKNEHVEAENNASLAAEPDPQPAPEIHSPVAPQLPSTHLLFPQDPRKAAPGPGIREPEKAPPVLAVYSIAGGAGKTTLCANLGKALCTLGEQLLLADATGRGLLPLYFGATELRAGVRKFFAPGANTQFIQVITGDEITPQWLYQDVQPLMAASQRTIFDLGPASQGVLSAILRMCTVVLVPLLPDLNSILTVSRIESSLHAQGGNAPAVFYLFNRFDEQSSSDQRAREFVARQCGPRLLPIVLRHSRQLAEALHGGLAGADYTPGSELSHDYLELGLWLRRVAPLNSAVLLPGRWSEQ